MIVFPAQCDGVVLYPLVRFGVNRLTLGWRRSPLAWMLLLLLVLFISMQ